MHKLIENKILKLNFKHLCSFLKKTLKILISIILFCFIVRLCLKLFRLENYKLMLKLILVFESKMPTILNYPISCIVNFYQFIEYFLWLFLYFFTNMIEFIVLFLFKVKLKSRPHDFAGLLTVFFLIYIFWILWSKKKL